MGVGGSFDVLSGHIKRAPLWMQKHGLEWFYRFLKEPKRMFRKAFIINLKFIYMVFEEKLKINKRSHREFNSLNTLFIYYYK